MCECADTPAKERYTQSQRREVDRVLTRAFRMNPYDILDLTQDADEKTIQKSYRKKSLLIHPDKMTEDQARAEEAFDLLKKSLDHLMRYESMRKGRNGFTPTGSTYSHSRYPTMKIIANLAAEEGYTSHFIDTMSSKNVCSFLAGFSVVWTRPSAARSAGAVMVEGLGEDENKWPASWVTR